MSAPGPPVIPWPPRPPRRILGVPAGLLVCWQAALLVALVAIGRPVGHVIGLGVAAATVIAVTGSRPRGRWTHEWVLLWLRYLLRMHREADPRQPAELGLLALAGRVESVTTVDIEGSEAAVICHAGGYTAVLELGTAGPQPPPASLLPVMLAPLSEPDAPEISVQLLACGSQTALHTLVAVQVRRDARYSADELRGNLVNAVRRLRRRLRPEGLEAGPLDRSGLMAALRSLTFLELAAPTVAGTGQSVSVERWRTMWTGSLPQESLAVRSWPGTPQPPETALLEALLDQDGPRTVSVAARRLRPVTTYGSVRAGSEVVALELMVRVAGPNRPALEAVVQRLRSRLAAAGAVVERLDGRQLPALAATLPFGGFLGGYAPDAGAYPPPPRLRRSRPSLKATPPASWAPETPPAPPPAPAPADPPPQPPAVPAVALIQPPEDPPEPPAPAEPFPAEEPLTPEPAPTGVPVHANAPVRGRAGVASAPARGQARVHPIPVQLGGVGDATTDTATDAATPALGTPAVVRATARVAVAPPTSTGIPTALAGASLPAPEPAAPVGAPGPDPHRAVRAYGASLFTAGSPRPAYVEHLLVLARSPQPAPQVVSVLSGEAGTGASTVAAGVAQTLATVRDDYTALLRVPHDAVDPATMTAVRGHHAFAVVDVGAHIGEATPHALAASTRVLVVTTADRRATPATRLTLDRVHRVHPALVSDAVIAVVCRTGRQYRRVSRGLSEDLTLHANRIVPIPTDSALSTMGDLGLPRLQPATREAYLRLAAMLASAGGQSGSGDATARPAGADLAAYTANRPS